MLSEAKKNDEFHILYVQIHIYIYTSFFASPFTDQGS